MGLHRINIAIFASGSGSNAENIVRYFENIDEIDINLIVSNNPNAFVLERARNLSVPAHLITRASFYNGDSVVQLLKEKETNWIVLAGFLWLVPKTLISAFKGRIVNIHPALLPKYGGKGMYGMNVHKAVVESGETETGITIHYVNEEYDKGDVIFQEKIPVTNEDSPESIAERVHALEYEHFPRVIESLVREDLDH